MQQLDFKTLKNPKQRTGSLAGQVYKELHWAIITGKIPSGTRLVESVLAEQMGVSRTPVREALQKLVSDGSVYSIPRAGYIVEDMSERDVVDLFMARAAVERIIVKLAAERITPDELKRLEANLQEMNKLLKGALTNKMIDLDTEFHQLLSSAARNKTLYELNQILIKRTLRFRVFCLRVPEIAKVTRDGHDLIVKALKSNDPGKAEDAILSHLEDTKKTVADYVEGLRRESFMSSEFEI
jgi:DNA-binding GntR family transcriptional regulator